MTRLRWFQCFTVIVACVVAAPPAIAQEPAAPASVTTADPPAHISFVDGTALLERDGRAENELRNMPLLAGDRVRTREGRVEILFGDLSTLHLDFNTTVDFQSDELVRLLDGRVRLSIPGPRRAVRYRIDAPVAWAQITEPGEYRVALSSAGEIELAVIRGAAELANDSGRTPLGAGERAFARESTAPSYAYVFNSASWDGFDRWSESRRDQRLGQSAQYLPAEVRPYTATFDQYGAWGYEASYGYVWYPRVVAGWRPYYYGRWHTYRPWGWTWIGTDAWAWPTHHYGRWGFSAGLWFWIPGRAWAPAWVSWAYAPGYVSWCPLGWNNRAVFQFGYVHRGYDPWHAWTVVPRQHFGAGYVHVRARSVGVIDARTRGSFVVGNSAPAIAGYAVPRSTAPIHAAGTGVPRSPSRANARSGEAGGARPSTVYTNLQNSRMSPGAPRVVVPGATASDRARARQGEPSATGSASPQRSQAREGARPGQIAAPDSGRAQARVRGATPNSQLPTPNSQLPTPTSPGAIAPGGDSYARPGLRAVPRNDPGSNRGNAAEPYRRPPSDANRAPGGVARERNAPAPVAPGSAARPLPSYGARDTYRPNYEARETYTPRQDYRRPPDNAPPSGGARAVPRGDYAPAPRPGGGGGGYERRAPMESRPSGPPAHAAPPQRSAPPSRAAEPGSRSRGDQPPSGGAARRRGGN